STISCAMRVMMRRRPSASMISAFSFSVTLPPRASRTTAENLALLALDDDPGEVPAAHEERVDVREQAQAIQAGRRVLHVHHHAREEVVDGALHVEQPRENLLVGAA